eukprot:jgi/Undpi1/11745/HiC_scaffold_37.g14040.m1
MVWLGSAELRRLDERAQDATAGQAAAFLRAAVLRIEDEVDRWVADALAPGRPPGRDENPLAAVRRAILDHPSTLDMVLVDDSGALTFPRPSPPSSMFPDPDLTSTPELARAKGWIELQEFESAHDEIEAWLQAGTEESDEVTLQMWARSKRALLLKRLGRTREALSAFREFLAAFPPKLDHVTDVPYAPFLAAIAEVELTGDENSRLELIEAIALGEYDRLGDEILNVGIQRLVSGMASDAPGQPEAIEAIAVNEQRMRGRRFATTYEREAQPVVARKMNAAGDDKTVFHVVIDGGETTLLALRRVVPEDRSAQAAQWVGVRADLTILLRAAQPFFDGSSGFTLSVADPDGFPIVPRELTTVPSAAETFTRDTASGLVVRAIPTGNTTEDRYRVVRNETILLGLLVLAAILAGVFLWRSVRRESELAGLKMEFVSRISHELKTPLALVRMYGETLAMGRGLNDEKRTHFAQIITRESERLTEMIERVLDVSRMDAGTLVYTRSPVDVGATTRAVTDAYRPRAEARGIDLTCSVPEGKPLIIAADPLAFESTLVNLLENAVKYTPTEASSPTIDVTVRPIKDRVELSVQDRGVGIPAEDRRRVFETFYRASNAGEVRGAGLGLNLVKHFVEGHDGTVQADSRDGGGTVIRLTFPRSHSTDT